MRDYDEAYDYALDFCNPRRERMTKPYYSDGALWATNGHIAIAIHDVERPLDEDKGDYVEQIKSVFRMVQRELVSGARYPVDMLGINKAFRAVLGAVAVDGNVYSCGMFDLSQGCICIREGVYINALYAQMAFSMFHEYGGDEIRAWVCGAGSAVLFKGEGWEIVVMPLREFQTPCADAVTGKIVVQNNEEN